jgi:hypothetical protein
MSRPLQQRGLILMNLNVEGWMLSSHVYSETRLNNVLRSWPLAPRIHVTCQFQFMVGGKAAHCPENQPNHTNELRVRRFVPFNCRVAPFRPRTRTECGKLYDSGLLTTDSGHVGQKEFGRLVCVTSRSSERARHFGGTSPPSLWRKSMPSKKPAEEAGKLKMQSVCSSETFGCLGTTRRYNPEDAFWTLMDIVQKHSTVSSR